MLDNFSICGSCHTLISSSDDPLCPRCGDAISPSFEDVLKRFIEYGIYVAKKGVPIREAQGAAQEALDELKSLRDDLG